jgi:hypothetical protein
MNISKLKAALGVLAVSTALVAQPALAATHHHTHHHYHCPHAKKHHKKHHAHTAKPKNPA